MGHIPPVGRMTAPVFCFVIFLENVACGTNALTSDNPDSFWSDTAKTKRASVVFSHLNRESLCLQNKDIYYRGERKTGKASNTNKTKLGDSHENKS